MARETWVQSQVESYQRLKKWYLVPPCLTLSIIRYGSRVKWSNPGKGVAPSPTPWCSKLSEREPSGHPRLWSPTLLTYLTQKPRFLMLIFQVKMTCKFGASLQLIVPIKIFPHLKLWRTKLTLINIRVINIRQSMRERGSKKERLCNPTVEIS